MGPISILLTHLRRNLDTFTGCVSALIPHWKSCVIFHGCWVKCGGSPAFLLSTSAFFWCNGWKNKSKWSISLQVSGAEAAVFGLLLVWENTRLPVPPALHVVCGSQPASILAPSKVTGLNLAQSWTSWCSGQNRPRFRDGRILVSNLRRLAHRCWE